MRQGPHQKRGRGRGNRRPNTPNRNQTFDSNGPDVRIRGNAHQVYEKYLTLGRDASASGDRVLAESYFQHADHYYRIMSAFAENDAERRDRNAGQGQQPSGGPRDWNDDEDDGEGEDSRGGNGSGNGQDERRAERRNGSGGRGAEGQGPDGQGSDGQSSNGQGDEAELPATEASENDDGGDGKPAPRRGRGRPRRAQAADEGTGAPATEEDGIRRTLRVAGGNGSGAEEAAAPAADESGEEEAPRPRRRRRTAEKPTTVEDDGAAAAS